MRFNSENAKARLSRTFQGLQKDFCRSFPFLSVVAGLTSKNDVSLCGAPPSSKGHNMVHGKLRSFESFFAVVTESLGQLLLPPLTLAQLAGFALFLFHLFRGYCQSQELVIQGTSIPQTCVFLPHLGNNRLFGPLIFW